MALFGDLLRIPGHLVQGAGKAFGLPEMGISEKLGVSKQGGIKFGGGGQPNLALNPYNTSSQPARSGAPAPASFGGGGAGGRGFAAPAYDPNVDPNQVARAREGVSTVQNQLNALYSTLFGDVDTLTNERRGEIDQNYDTEFQNNDKQYMMANEQVNGAMTGRNTYDSSYRGNALDSNKKDYDTSNTRLSQGRDANYADLGKFAETTKQSFEDSKPKYDLSQYNDVNSLSELRTQLDKHIQNISGQRAGLKTNAAYRGTLNAIAPSKSTLDTQLKGRIDALMNSGADPASKLGILKSYTGKLPKAQQDEWMQYYMSQNPKAV